MLRIRALGPCTISGFQTLRSGDVCDVPVDRREQVERLRIAERVELLEYVAAEPSGKEAPTEDSSPAPAALETPDDVAALEAELARLTAEAEAAEAATPAAPEVPAVPKRPIFVCVCGKTAPEHQSGKVRLDDSACGQLKKFMKRAP